MSSLGISVTIAGRTYRLTVENESEEEIIRKAANEINDKVKVYSEIYSFKDQQDLLAMVCLEIATRKNADQRVNYNEKAELLKSLNDINNLLQ